MASARAVPCRVPVEARIDLVALPVLSAVLLGSGGNRKSPGRPLSPLRPTSSIACWRWRGSTKDDVVYDLGCGDGRIVIAAAQKFGARGVGVDIDPVRVAEAQRNAALAGVEQPGDLQASGCARDRRLGRDRRDALPARVAERGAQAALMMQLQPGRADRLPQLRHGRLGARRRRHLHQRRPPDANAVSVENQPRRSSPAR